METKEEREQFTQKTLNLPHHQETLNNVNNLEQTVKKRNLSDEDQGTQNTVKRRKLSKDRRYVISNQLPDQSPQNAANLGVSNRFFNTSSHESPAISSANNISLIREYKNNRFTYKLKFSATELDKANVFLVNQFGEGGAGYFDVEFYQLSESEEKGTDFTLEYDSLENLEAAINQVKEVDVRSVLDQIILSFIQQVQQPSSTAASYIG